MSELVSFDGWLPNGKFVRIKCTPAYKQQLMEAIAYTERGMKTIAVLERSKHASS